MTIKKEHQLRQVEFPLDVEIKVDSDAVLYFELTNNSENTIRLSSPEFYECMKVELKKDDTHLIRAKIKVNQENLKQFISLKPKQVINIPYSYKLSTIFPTIKNQEEYEIKLQYTGKLFEGEIEVSLANKIILDQRFSY